MSTHFQRRPPIMCVISSRKTMYTVLIYNNIDNMTKKRFRRISVELARQMTDVAEKRCTPPLPPPWARTSRSQVVGGGGEENEKNTSRPQPGHHAHRRRRRHGESPPRARDRAVSNMTDKRASGVRRWRPWTPDAGLSDAGPPNMGRARKNGTQIGRPGGVTGEKPSQVCGQSVRRRADDRLASRVRWSGRGVREKKSHDGRRRRRPDGCAQMLPMSHAACSCASRVSPPTLPGHHR